MKMYKVLLLVSTALALTSCSMATVKPVVYLKSGDMTMEVVHDAPNVLSIAYSPDGKGMASSGYDGTVKIWDTDAGKLAKQLKVTTGVVCQVKYFEDGKSLLTGDSEGFIRIWDIKSGTETKQFSGYSCVRHNFAMDVVNAGQITLSTDNKSLFFRDSFATSGGVLKSSYSLLDLTTGVVSRRFDGMGGKTGFISADSRYAFVSQNLYDLRSGKELWRTSYGDRTPNLFSQLNIPLGMTFSPDNRQLLLSAPVVTMANTGFSGKFSCSSTISLLNVSNGAEVRRFTLPATYALTASFFPDAKSFISYGNTFGSDMSHTILNFETWDTQTGEMIRQFSVDEIEAKVMTVPAFSPGNRFVVVSAGSSLQHRDTLTGEVLATYIGFDDGEWLVITPNGYYNASEKGDQYLNVTVGGQTYSIAQLRESFFRPDLVQLALSGGSLKEFRKMAEIKPPPAVTIVDTPGNVTAQEATITLKVSDAGGGIGDIRLYLNGSAVVLDSSRGITAAAVGNSVEAYRKYTVKLTSGVNTIRAIAFNGDNSMQSSDALHTITATFQSLSKPSLYALVIGINEYKNPKLQLNFAVADAGLFADTLKKGADPLFDKVVVKTLSTKEATTQENIIRELKGMQSLNPDDLFVFYVASHGTVDDGEYYLITSNVGLTRTEKLRTDALSQSTIKELISNIPATKKLIVLDTCNAGALGEAIQVALLTRGMSEDTAVKILSRAVGSTILSASTSVQEALEGYQGHGLFTFVLAEGLKGNADKGKSGYVKTTELADYVGDEVPMLAEKIFKRAQYPTISISGQAFPVGMTR